MPCCVECGRVADATYRTSPTTRMDHCKRCNQLVDKYEEYDFVIIMIAWLDRKFPPEHRGNIGRLRSTSRLAC
jgi:hypothetical protein